MKTLKEYWTFFFNKERECLESHYPGITLFRFLKEVDEILIKYSRNPAIELLDSDYSVPRALLQKIEKLFLIGKPFSYILEMSEFYENKFYITSDVLIPRSETEELVDYLVERFKSPVNKVLDVGVGSGVILLSLLAKNVAIKGVGVDISEAAIEVARINARRLRVLDRVEFIISDRLENINSRFDIIVSNPPYIKAKSHLPLVHQQVLEHEPYEALFLSDEEYDVWFEVFFQQVSDHLKPNGLFMMEGHEEELQNLSLKLGKLDFSKIEIKKDLSQRDRFLICHK